MRITDNLRLGFTSFNETEDTTLVFTPGWATDSNFLMPLKEMFKDFHVLLVDMPGYGKSKHLKEFANSLRRSANLLLNTIPHDCTLISWSLSSLTAILAASMDTEHKIKRLVTVCGSPRFPADPNWPGFDYKYVVKSLRLFDSGKTSRNIRLFFKLQTNDLTHEQNRFLLDSFDKMGEVDTTVLKTGLELMAHSDIREAMLAIKIPCLHIFGGKDKLVKPALASRLSQMTGNRSVVFSDSAHIPFLTEPELFIRTISDFINLSR